MKNKKTMSPKVKRFFAIFLCIAVVCFFFTSLYIAVSIFAENFFGLIRFLGAESEFSEPIHYACGFGAGIAMFMVLPISFSESFRGTYSGCVKLVDQATGSDPDQVESDSK